MNSDKKKLKILVVTNLFPPHYIGGYELFCQDVVDGLKKQGHVVTVITSTYGVVGHQAEEDVHRVLHLIEPFEKGADYLYDKQTLLRLREKDKATLNQCIQSTNPDLLYVWHMANLDRSLMNVLVHSGIPIVYHFEDRWIPSFYHRRFKTFLGIHTSYFIYALKQLTTFGVSDYLRIVRKLVNRLIKQILPDPIEPTESLVELDLSKSIFLAQALREEHQQLGYNVDGSVVVHNGIAVSKFAPKSVPKPPATPVRLLYVGRVAEKKGVHTFVRALIELNKSGYSFEASVVGEYESESYIKRLKKMLSQQDLLDKVRFVHGVSREQIVEQYHAHDILVFPSIWEEPFGLVLVEAMAAGLPIVSTRRGGTKEFLRHGHNALVFEPLDSGTLTQHIITLIDSEELYTRLQKQALEFVEENFSLDKKILEIEDYLYRQIA